MTTGTPAYFVGGAKGVGKSTLLRSVSAETGLAIMNTGSYFRNGRDPGAAKQSIISDIAARSPLLVDTHYAGFTKGIYSDGFERGLFSEELAELDRWVDLELILVDLDAETLLRRRKNDLRNSRDLNPRHLAGELESNRRYFQEYCAQLGRRGTVIINNWPDKAYAQMLSVIVSREMQRA